MTIFFEIEETPTLELELLDESEALYTAIVNQTSLSIWIGAPLLSGLTLNTSIEHRIFEEQELVVGGSYFKAPIIPPDEAPQYAFFRTTLKFNFTPDKTKIFIENIYYMLDEYDILKLVCTKIINR